MMQRKAPYIISGLTSVAAWSCLIAFLPQSDFNAIYDQKLQFALFTAFLTVGSFLLAMKAFILVRLRDDIYKHDSYETRYLNQNNNSYCGNYYRGLIDLGHLLVVSVLSSFTASIAQVSIGFVPRYSIKLLAPSFCVGVLVLVLFDWLFVYLNLRDWFTFIEEEAGNTIKDKIKKKKEQAAQEEMASKLTD